MTSGWFSIDVVILSAGPPVPFVALVLKTPAGGESDREISMAPACVILWLGIRSQDSAPRGRARALERI